MFTLKIFDLKLFFHKKREKLYHYLFRFSLMIRGPIIFIICDFFFSSRINEIGGFIGITPFLGLLNIGFESLLYKDHSYNFQKFQQFGLLRVVLLLILSLLLLFENLNLFLVLNFIIPFVLDSFYSIHFTRNNIQMRISKNLGISSMRSLIYVGSLLLTFLNENFNYLVLLDVAIVFYLFIGKSQNGGSKIQLNDIYHLINLTSLGFLSSFLLRHDLIGFGENNNLLIVFIVYLGYSSTLLQELTQYLIVFKNFKQTKSIISISLTLFLLSLSLFVINPLWSFAISFISWRILYSEYIANLIRTGKPSIEQLIFIVPLLLTILPDYIKFNIVNFVYLKLLIALIMILITCFLQKKLNEA